MTGSEWEVHVATTRRKHGEKVYETHLLRRTYRCGGKVKHETLGNISHLPSEVIGMIRLALKGEAFLPASSHLEVVRSLPHGHVACILGTMRKLGLEGTIASRPSRERDPPQLSVGSSPVVLEIIYLPAVAERSRRKADILFR